MAPIAQEAAVICTNNAGRVMNMTSAAQQDMHQGVRAGDGQRVAAACRQLGFEGTTARLPIRILVTLSGAHLTPIVCPYVLPFLLDIANSN